SVAAPCESRVFVKFPLRFQASLLNSLSNKRMRAVAMILADFSLEAPERLSPNDSQMCYQILTLQSCSPSNQKARRESSRALSGGRPAVHFCGPKMPPIL